MNTHTSQPSGTAMRPQTAAKKLGIYLPATPEEFQSGAITHAQLRELQTTPPEWLSTLRREGPHPRPVVAQKLGISVTALKKNDMDRPLPPAEIKPLLADRPGWLEQARQSHAEQRSDAASQGPEDAAATADVAVDADLDTDVEDNDPDHL